MHGFYDIANLGADMLTNPISCSIAHTSPWMLCQFTLLIAKLGTDVFTSPTVVQLHVKIHRF